ncbi:hypothetical protein XENOCAPTIV_026817 [Xenoophorus captivus]|uniref:Uncharacterized protein n=1 Tax=Xenoophorus captivus TaxID=1517983 RepID=A0ABV0QV16_9TELE
MDEVLGQRSSTTPPGLIASIPKGGAVSDRPFRAQQTCGRRCSGQIRPTLNFLTYKQKVMYGGKPTLHILVIKPFPCETLWWPHHAVGALFFSRDTSHSCWEDGWS